MEKIWSRLQSDGAKRAIYENSVIVYFGLIAIAIVFASAVITYGALQVVILVVGLCVVATWLRSYKTACMSSIFFLPYVPTYLLSKEQTGVSNQSIMLIILISSITSMFFASALRPGRISIPKFPKILFFYLAVFIIGTINGARSAASIPDYFLALGVVKSTTATSYIQSAILSLSVIILTAVTTGVAVANTANPKHFLPVVFLSAAVFASLVCYHAAAANISMSELAGEDSRRYLSGLGLHANEIGLLLNTAWALCLAATIYSINLYWRLALAAVTIILTAAITLTFSRGAYLGMFIGLIYLVSTSRRKLVSLTAVVALGAVILIVPQSINRASHGIGNGDIDGISSGRVDNIWTPLLPEIAKSPVIGAGLGSILWSEAARNRTILPVGHPHSAYLASILDVGIVGTIVVLLFFRHLWCIFRQLSKCTEDKMLRGFFHGAAACVLVLFTQGVTDDSFMPSYTHSFIWIAYGVAIGMNSRASKFMKAQRDFNEREKM